jgi:hypothetical protein
MMKAIVTGGIALVMVVFTVMQVMLFRNMMVAVSTPSGGFTGTSYTGYTEVSRMQRETDSVLAWYTGCNAWKMRGCGSDDIGFTISRYDGNGDGRDDTMADACAAHLGYFDMEDCWRECCRSAI